MPTLLRIAVMGEVAIEVHERRARDVSGEVLGTAVGAIEPPAHVDDDDGRIGCRQRRQLGG